MSKPTHQDLENARRRDAISARFQAEYDQCAAWAHQIMDKGWLPCGRHYLIDKAEEDQARKEMRSPQVAATCYSVTNGASRRHFVVRDGKPIEVADYKEAFGDMLNESHPTMRIEVKGQIVAPHRYSVCWGSIELYEPRSPEQLAEARAKRQEQAVKREAEENPLFAELIRKEGYQKPPRKRSK